MWVSTVAMLTFIFHLVGFAHSANILAVLPHTGRSHFDVFEPLMLALAAKGHRLTVISFFPQKARKANYTDVSIAGVMPIFVNALKFESLEGMDPFTDFLTITGMGVQSCEPILSSSPVQNLINSSQTFDLIFIEMFTTDCFLAFVERYRVPYIGISSSSFFPTVFPRLGGFDNPSYFPNLFLPFASSMSFSQRVINTVGTALMRASRTFLHSAREHEVVRRTTGLQIDLEQIARNMSLVFVNSHFSVQGSRPLVPAAVEIGGIHIHAAKPLPQVYVTLGP